MQDFPKLPDEEKRIKALHSYDIVDTVTEQDFDDLTELASIICGVPIALISLVDANRQWFKSRQGLAVSETKRTESFCAHAIAKPDEVMVVEDAHEDERFKDNPLVTGDLNLTFYAGVPLVDKDGFALGSLCVIDSEKRQLSEAQLKALKTLSRQVMDKLELRRKHGKLEESEARNKQLQEQVNAALSELTETEDNLQMAVAGANLGQWILKLPSHELYVSDGYKKQFGLLPDEEMTLADVLTYVEPEYHALITETVRVCEEEGSNLFIEFAIRHKVTGERRWIRGVGKTEADAEGKATRIIGMNVDFTAQKNYEEKVQELNEELQVANEELRVTNEELHLINGKYNYRDEVLNLALEGAAMGLWQIHTTNNSTVLSDQMKRIHGIPADADITFAEALETVAEEYREGVAKAVAEAMETGELFSQDYKINPMDGRKSRWVRSLGIVTNSEDGQDKILAGVCIDITEQKQDEQRKSDFISMVSHEMKAPLAVVLNSMQVIEMTDATANPIVKQMTGMSIKQVRKMTSLINGFLNVSRIESGKIHLDKQPFLLYPVIEQLVTEFSLANPNFSFRYEACENLLVVADTDKIGNVISNFLSNAVKYSPAGTTISVSCQPEHEGGAKVSVKDEGPGIPAAAQEKLFDRFYRVDTVNSKTITGFGIGLYLCAEIVQVHGGQIGVESEVGRGSTFWFTVPGE